MPRAYSIVPIAPSQRTVRPANSLSTAAFPVTELPCTSSNPPALIVSNCFFHPKPPRGPTPNMSLQRSITAVPDPFYPVPFVILGVEQWPLKLRRSAQVGVGHR